MEQRLHGNKMKKYRTYLFGELNHPQVIKHTDGQFTR